MVFNWVRVVKVHCTGAWMHKAKGTSYFIFTDSNIIRPSVIGTIPCRQSVYTVYTYVRTGSAYLLLAVTV